MFSFLKHLQNLSQKLKRKKGLWFTLLAAVSIAGIFTSMITLSFMTQNVSEEIYENISQSYNKSIRNKISERELNFKKSLLIIESDKSFLKSITENATAKIKVKIDSYNKSFRENNFVGSKITFYPSLNKINQYRNSVSSVIEQKNSNFGIEVLAEGVFLLYLNPIIINGKLIGVLEIREPLDSFKNDYARERKIYLFLLDQKMLNKLSNVIRNKEYKEIVRELYVNKFKYNTLFYGKILEDGEKAYSKLLSKGYSVDKLYFKTYRKISDINGNNIGVVVLGEVVEGSGAFVNIVDNLTKTVTTVALGLVISILLFMF